MLAVYAGGGLPSTALAEPVARRSAAAPDHRTKGTPLKIRFRFAHDEFTITLVDHAASREFAAMLPLTLKVSDFAASEKIAYLPRKLDVQKLPPGTEAEAGDLAYYAPWGNVALFYRKAPYAQGLVRLGRLDGTADRISNLPEGTVSIERVGD